ncbi:MAG: imidazole glycerol phosphate synthase subunit HisH [Bacteroidetes bacterium]|nr:imidazole glycerol phosphate synthase subunit HisH [Bacteroidota bacterium]
MIAIIDYKAGNLMSVSNALLRIGATFQVTYDKNVLDQADAVIFPGVGHAEAAMQALAERDLVAWLQQTTKPVLGICLGMQLLYESSEEGNTNGLGVLPGRLLRFDETLGKVPHLGWNAFASIKDHPLLSGLQPEQQMYYVHSYYAPVTADTVASCDYQLPFTAVAARGNFMGAQFHPEKSGPNGEHLLRNFLSLVHSTAL